MHLRHDLARILLAVIANARIRRVGTFGVLLTLSLVAHAALDEANGNNPFTLYSPVSIGTYFDFAVQIRNKGATSVNLTGLSTTGPFALQWNTCGASLAPGAACSGNIGLRFTPVVAGSASGSLVVGNDSGDGPFTLRLVASGTALLPPTVSAAFNPNSIYPVTGVSTLAFTLVNPNAVPLTPVVLNLNLPYRIRTAASPNPASTCGGGAWFGPGNRPPSSEQQPFFLGQGRATIPANGSCVISIDVTSTDAPGTYTFMPPQFSMQEVWSTIPAGISLTVIAPIPGAPGAPAILSATRGNAQVTVTFAAPPDAGTTAITGYTVTSKPAGGTDTNAGSTSLSHVVAGLSNGTAYTFTVAATNSAGTGVPSAPSDAVTPATTPGAPANAIATAENAQAVVTFAAPASDGGNPILGYAVTSSPAGGVDSDAGSLGFSHRITGLANGTEYTFTVIASNTLGAGGPSAPSNRIMPAALSARTLAQLTYQVPQTRSLIATPTPAVTPGPRVTSFVPTLQSPRIFEFADLNGDGYLDIIVAPHFPQSPPKLPIAIWLNRGDGTFYDGTADIIEGAPPITWSATQTLIGDFNNDGRPDVFFINTGAEFAAADGLLDSGFNNTLLLSQPNGKYKDATAQIPSNSPAFNHMGGLGDANGDGNLDVVVNAGATTLVKANGIKLFYGDGKGNFIDATNALPPEIRYMLDSQRPGDQSSPTFEFQPIGCTTLADLDGDGKAEVITGTYSSHDGGPDHTRTIRFHRLGADGKFVERGRVSIPDAIANIEYGYDPPPTEFLGLGCSQILAGDFNGDGRIDLLVQWEGAGKWYVELLRNDGNFQFTDITLEALGTYQEGYLDNTTPQGPGHYRLMDVNGDGTLDIVSQLNASSIPGVLEHTARLNDGSGHFTPWVLRVQSEALTSADILSAAKCTSCSYMPFVFDTNRSGLASLVLLDFMSLVTASTPSQTTAVYLTTFAPNSSAGAPVVEFYNNDLDNYFITANAGEAPAIDSGSAGPGWARTGNTFKSGGSAQVCRFYGSQSPGPNSHFYTVDPAECESLKQIQAITPATERRWNFESLDFQSTPPTNGSCPSGTMAVYRAYNNGFTRGVDSNHRITRNFNAIVQQVNRGWRNEGVVMCAPQ